MQHLLHCFKYLLVVLGRETIDDIADVFLKIIGVLEACLHLFLVVHTGESFHESSKVVGNLDGVQGVYLPVWFRALLITIGF